MRRRLGLRHDSLNHHSLRVLTDGVGHAAQAFGLLGCGGLCVALQGVGDGLFFGGV